MKEQRLLVLDEEWVHLYLRVKILQSLIPQFATVDFSCGVLRQDVAEEDAARANNIQT
jgi:hypothetical protein